MEFKSYFNKVRILYLFIRYKSILDIVFLQEFINLDTEFLRKSIAALGGGCLRDGNQTTIQGITGTTLFCVWMPMASIKCCVKMTEDILTSKESIRPRFFLHFTTCLQKYLLCRMIYDSFVRKVCFFYTRAVFMD